MPGDYMYLLYVIIIVIAIILSEFYSLLLAGVESESRNTYAAQNQRRC